MTLTLGDGTDADTVAVVHSSSKSYGAATAYTGGGEDNLGNGTYFQVSGGTVFEIKGTALGGTKVANGVISANVEVFVGTTETAVTCEFHANTTTGFSFQFYDQTGTVIDLPTFMDGTPGNNIKARFAYLVS
jgi:hypothetical protein